MRPDIVGLVFAASGLVSFNAGVWQIVRRGKKKDLIESYENLRLPPLHDLPEREQETLQRDAAAQRAARDRGVSATDDRETRSVLARGNQEYRRVEWEGTLDNEGSVLVGPRPVPSYKGARNTDESKGGFLVFTPFEVAGTKQFVMVNRGFVPVDAGKHRTILAQYIGEGFTPMRLRGVLRREEWVASWGWGEHPDNFRPAAEDLAWQAIRPFEILSSYLKARFIDAVVRQHQQRRIAAAAPAGEPQQQQQPTAAAAAAAAAPSSFYEELALSTTLSDEQKLAELRRLHGGRHYYVEMIEDFSGDDQRILRNNVWPRRRDVDEVTHVHLPPAVHTAYVVFWFSVSALSFYGMMRSFARAKMLTVTRRAVERRAATLEMARREEAAAHLAAGGSAAHAAQQLAAANAAENPTPAKLDAPSASPAAEKK